MNFTNIFPNRVWGNKQQNSQPVYYISELYLIHINTIYIEN